MEPWQHIVIFVILYFAVVTLWIKGTSPLASDTTRSVWNGVRRVLVFFTGFGILCIFTSMFDKPK